MRLSHKTPPFSTPFASSLKQAAKERDTSGFGFVLPVVLHLAIFQIFPLLEETIAENGWCGFQISTSQCQGKLGNLSLQSSSH